MKWTDDAVEDQYRRVTRAPTHSAQLVQVVLTVLAVLVLIPALAATRLRRRR